MARKKGSRYSAGSRGRQGPRGRSGSGRVRGLGILFWLCLLAIIVAVGFAAWQPIRAGVARVFGLSTPATQSPTVTITPLPDAEPGQKAPAARETATPATKAPASSTAAPPATTRTQPAQTIPTKPAPAAGSEKPASRKARLYFATVDDSGRIIMRSVIRSIPASDSPLRDTLQSLLKGPTAQELNLGLISLIPPEAALRSVTMKGDTAVADFSEGFRFNGQGMDAMNAQLRQVVYAATEFPSVKRVQIRIEGKTVRYLGTEGVRIDEPLGRSSFPD